MNKDKPKPEEIMLRLQAVSVELNTVRDHLTTKITTLEGLIKKANPGVSAWVTIATARGWETLVGYAKLGNKWGILLRRVEVDERGVRNQDKVETWHFGESPTWLRVQGVARIPELLEALARNTTEMCDQVVRAQEVVEIINQAILEVTGGVTGNQA